MQSTRREVRHGRLTKNHFQGSRKAEETSQSLTCFLSSGKANHGKQMMQPDRKAIARAQPQKTEAGVSTLLSISPFLA
jgi:hypothetical protein